MSDILYIPGLFGISIEVYFVLIALSVPVYFISRGIFGKTVKSNKIKSLLTWSTTIFIVPIIYGLCVFLFYLIFEYYPNLDFNKMDWLNNKKSRYEYSKSIIESKMLIGKIEKEVVQILGPATYGGTLSVDQMVYNLSDRPDIMPIDPYCLFIEIDKGTVVSV